MITLIKGLDSKILSEDSKLLDILLKQGWELKLEEKEVKNGKSSKSSN